MTMTNEQINVLRMIMDNKKILEELLKNNLHSKKQAAVLPIETDLFSHDGLRDYGKCNDMLSIITYDLYRNNRGNIKEVDSWYWTCTPDSISTRKDSSCVQCVFSSGNVDYSGCDFHGGVRPFFILKSSIFIS